jgi:hypothetical protein
MADEAGGNDQSKSAPEPVSPAPAFPSGSAWKLPTGIEDHIESGKPDDGGKCSFGCYGYKQNFSTRMAWRESLECVHSIFEKKEPHDTKAESDFAGIGGWAIVG